MGDDTVDGARFLVLAAEDVIETLEFWGVTPYELGDGISATSANEALVGELTGEGICCLIWTELT